MKTEQEIKAAIKQLQELSRIVKYERKFSMKDVYDAKAIAMQWVLEELDEVK
jgi:hypothetical protein